MIACVFLQAELVSLKEGWAYVSFGIVLFVWEFLPTLAVVLFYRVRIPKTSQVGGKTFYIILSSVYIESERHA